VTSSVLVTKPHLFIRAVLYRRLAREGGLVPAVEQNGADPEVPYAEARAGVPRTVNVQLDSTRTQLSQKC